MLAKEGDRVLAIRNTKDGVAYIYGYGAYEGRHKPPGLPMENPKIKLDNGDIIWGYQCWWGNAKAAEERLAGHKFVEVPVPDENK